MQVIAFVKIEVCKCLEIPTISMLNGFCICMYVNVWVILTLLQLYDESKVK